MCVEEAAVGCGKGGRIEEGSLGYEKEEAGEGDKAWE